MGEIEIRPWVTTMQSEPCSGCVSGGVPLMKQNKSPLGAVWVERVYR